MENNEALPQENHSGGNRNMLSQDLWNEIRFMAKLGKPVKAIARELSISKNTVKKALHQEKYEPYHRQHTNAGLLTEFLPFLVERAPQLDFNATSMYQELQKRGYTGGYTLVKEAVRPLRETYRQVEVATARFETPPGLQAQMDWGSRQVVLGGRRIRLHIFVMVLGYSRAIYVEFTLDEKLPTLIACHERAFQWFGGIPEEILYDNPRTIVFDRGTANARLNPRFEDFCRYYGYTPRLCRPYRAKTKGKVESGVKYVKHSFLPGKEFLSLDHANQQVQHWVTDVADQRIHGTVHERPADRFKRESLRPMAGKPCYLLQESQLRKVASDCLVSFDASRYSVPWQYVHQTVELQTAPDGWIHIYHAGKLIAQHKKAEAKYQVFMEPEHYQGLLHKPKTTLNQGYSPTLLHPEVQVRSLDVYESLAVGGGLHG
ncbi:MAG: IS21 family transposase [Ignavibacteriales bacterium]